MIEQVVLILKLKNFFLFRNYSGNFIRDNADSSGSLWVRKFVWICDKSDLSQLNFSFRFSHSIASIIMIIICFECSLNVNDELQIINLVLNYFSFKSV